MDIAAGLEQKREVEKRQRKQVQPEPEDLSELREMFKNARAWHQAEPAPKFWAAGDVVPLTTSIGNVGGLNYTSSSASGSTSFTAAALR